MPPYIPTEGVVRVPLRADTDVVVVPDSLAGYFPPIPSPAPIEAPSTAVALIEAPAPVEAPPTPAVLPEIDERNHWTASEYVMCGLAVALIALVTTIVVALVHVVSSVVTAVSAVVAFISNGAGLVVAGGVVLLVWRLAAKLSTPSLPAPIATAAATVTAVVHPVATAAKLVKGEPVIAPAPVTTPKQSGTGDPVLDQWIADLRNPAHNQSTGSYREDDNTMCAVGWLLNQQPRAWKGRFGDVRAKMHAKYGRRNLDRIEGMNDSGGYSLPDIAKHVEKKLS